MKDKGLYRSEFEHDACGIGAVANIEGIKSHKTLEDALNILSNLQHRGGTGADGKTGDGAGVLFQIPHRFFKCEGQKKGIILPESGEYAVGMLFLPTTYEKRVLAVEILEDMLSKNNLEVLFWRDVPSNDNVLGDAALKAKPEIKQIVVKIPEPHMDRRDFDKLLYLTRREYEKKDIFLFRVI